MFRSYRISTSFCADTYWHKTRSWADVSGEYRYGFNGIEKDFETANDNFPIAIGVCARIYDSRLGRWLSFDPEFKYYPSYTPYNFAFNIPIKLIDIQGRVLGDPLSIETNIGTLIVAGVETLSAVTYEEILIEITKRTVITPVIPKSSSWLLKASLLITMLFYTDQDHCCGNEFCGLNFGVSCSVGKAEMVKNGKVPLEIITSDPSTLPDWYGISMKLQKELQLIVLRKMMRGTIKNIKEDN